MNESPKIAMYCFGTPMKYRFDLLLKSCSDVVKNYIVIFTTKYYFELYKDYHDLFTFVIIDDLRKDNLVSLQNEICMETSTDEEFFFKFNQFYSINKIQVPLFLNRYILKYFSEKNILNFVIVDTDIVIRNDIECIKDFFNNIPVGSVYAWNQGYHTKESSYVNIIFNFLEKCTNNQLPKFKLENFQFRNDDSFIYGGNFKNKKDLLLLFNLIDTFITESFSLNQTLLFKGTYYHNFIWTFPTAFDILKNNLDYLYLNAQDLTHLPKWGNIIIHKTRPEDTFHSVGSRSCWDHFSFDYSDVTSISKFIKNNKLQLKKYYDQHLPILEITDTHVYTTIGN